MSILYKRIEKLCKEQGVNITVMCKESGASRGSLSDLKFGRKQNLSVDTLTKIASYFNISVDTLLGEEQKNNPPSELIPTEREARILEALRSKSPAEQKALLTLLGISED